MDITKRDSKVISLCHLDACAVEDGSNTGERRNGGVNNREGAGSYCGCFLRSGDGDGITAGGRGVDNTGGDID